MAAVPMRSIRKTRRPLTAALVGMAAAVIPRSRNRSIVIGAALALSFTVGPTSPSFAIMIDGIEYAVLGIGGASVAVTSDFEIYQSGTVINGNVGEGPFSLVSHGIDSTINGAWYFDTATDTSSNPSLPRATASGTPVAVTGTVSGGFISQDKSTVTSAANAQAIALTGLSPTQTFSTLTSGQVINLAHGQNVIDIQGAVHISGGGTTLTINGFADSSVIFDELATGSVQNVFTLSGTTMMLNTFGGGTAFGADDITWLFCDPLTGGQCAPTFSLGHNDISITSGATVFGTFLGPNQQFIVDHGHVTGEIVGGGNGAQISIHSGSTVTSPTGSGGGLQTEVPEPGSLILLGSALAGLGLLTRYRRATRSEA